jgi:uncharacterized protein (TIGR02246 family)
MRGAAATPAVAAPRPLLVSVDDLPISGGLHPDPSERRAITRGLLAALRAHRVRAVGLVTWANVRDESDVELLREWLRAGHELGNHSSRHLSLTVTPVDEYLADVEQARARLQALLDPLGRRVRFFRFPFLREGDTRAKLDALRAYLERSGQRNLSVTIDDQDWSFEEPWTLAVRAGDKAAQARVADAYHEALHVSVRHHEARGDQLFGRATPQVLLLHANAVGARQWPRLFDWLVRNGHRFASADEVLADPAFERLPAVLSTHGYGLWDRLRQEKQERDARAAVADLLARQSAAWSAGDVAGFCAFYDDDAVFVSSSGVTRGRQALEERYRQRYPSRAAMGALTLEPVEIHLVQGMEVTLLGDATPGRVQGASVVARWTLRRSDQEPASGLTLLVLRPARDGWRIVQDASF